MANGTFNLPERDDMLAKLVAVNGESHLRQKFYPLLLKHAGEPKVAMGVVMLLQLAIDDYTEGMSPVMVASMNMWMPQYIEALCPTETAVQEAKAMWEKVVGG
ncbi:MAG: hypothetical protein Q7S95_00470 [bacterium]|nr:hypothetical protein [bacterium]